VAKKKTTATSKGRRRRIWLAVAILALLFGAAAAWKWTPLADQIEIRKVAAWAFSLRNNPARPVIILAAYLIGSLIMVPITVLIIATALVFGPVLGSFYSLAGSLLGSVVTYAVGYFLGRDFVRQIIGSKWKVVERKVGQAGILAATTLRLLPIAPFTIVNVISGAFQVPIRDFIIGSVLGLAPGIIVINLFAQQMVSAIRNPGVASYTLLGASVVVSVLGILWLRRKVGKERD
jgi:phospholipase D1/2